MTQVNGAGQPPVIDPSANIHIGSAGETKKASVLDDAAQTQQPPSTAETAEKVAEAVNNAGAQPEGAADEAPQADGTSSYEQAQSEESGSFFSSFNFAPNFAGSLTNSTSAFFSNIHETVVDLTGKAAEGLSLASLQQTGIMALDGAADFVTESCDSFVNSSPVSTVSGWISDAAEAVGSGAKATGSFARSNFLPVAVVALSVFTAVKSAQSAKENFDAGNLKKSAAQIFVGAAAAVLAGSIIHQSGVVQDAGARFQNLFASSEGTDEV